MKTETAIKLPIEQIKLCQQLVISRTTGEGMKKIIRDIAQQTLLVRPQI